VVSSTNTDKLHERIYAPYGVVSAYMLAFAATLITAGSLGDLFGRKRVFLLGIAGFRCRQPGRGACAHDG
jgi:MFS family permease